MSLQIIDYVVLGVFALALIVGFVKGLLSQLFTLAAMGCAAAVAYFGAPTVSGLLAGVLTDAATRNLVTLVALFLLSLIIFSIIFGAISKALRKIRIFKVIDVILGGVLAVGIVYALVAVIYGVIYMPYNEGSRLDMILPFFQKFFDKSTVLNIIYSTKNPIGDFALGLLKLGGK